MDHWFKIRVKKEAISYIYLFFFLMVFDKNARKHKLYIQRFYAVLEPCHKSFCMHHIFPSLQICPIYSMYFLYLNIIWGTLLCRLDSFILAFKESPKLGWKLLGISWKALFRSIQKVPGIVLEMLGKCLQTLLKHMEHICWEPLAMPEHTLETY